MTPLPEDRFAARLLALIEPRDRAAVEALPDGAALIASLFTSATARWPEVTLAPDDFAAYLAARWPESELERSLRNWSAADLYLCCACVHGDERAVAAFHRRYVSVIDGALRRLRLNPALVEEVRQSLLHKLLVADHDRSAMASGYRGAGSLASWLRVVASRVGRRQLEREKRLVPVSDGFIADRLLDDAAGGDARSAKRAYRQAFKVAFKQAMAALPPKEQNLLRHRYADRLGLAEIGAIYRVHHSTVHRWLDKTRLRLLEQTHRLLADQLQISRGECASIIRMIQSDFDITLHTFFRGDAPRRG